jgi:UDP-3-O-[3-hydroxymyristoyl] glucosamine N-acyltransferase
MKYKVSEIAAFLKRDFKGEDREIIGCNTLMNAGKDEISFLANPKYVKYLSSTKAATVVLEPKYADEIDRCIISPDPYLDFAKVVGLFAKEQGEYKGISSLSYIHPDAVLEEGVIVYPFVFVGPRARIGKNTKLFMGVYIGEDCSVGEGCIFYPNVVVMGGCSIGNKVILHPGVVIGADGFGFALGDKGREKFPQIGRVVIEDEVEIGANTTIDRAALGETRIGKGTKIDNQVQIGHNVEIGPDCVIVAQVGIAGSTKVGQSVILAGQVGIVGHVNIADGCVIGAKSGINKDIKRKGIYSGSPFMEHNRFLKTCAVIPKLPDMYRELKRLRNEIEDLKEELKKSRG